MGHKVVGALVAGVILSMSAQVSAADFRPFSPVQDVCPTCPKSAEDQITLNNDTKIRAKIVAENDDFFVLARYGEVRILPKERVLSVEWANNSQPSGLDMQDQVLLTTGHVVTGSIIEEQDKPAYFKIQSSINQQTYIVFKAQAEAVYRGGRRVTN